MTKKVPKKILRIERNFFVNLRKSCFWPPTPRRAAAAAAPPPPPTFLDRRAPPPPTEIDRRAAADTMTSAHSSSWFMSVPPSVTFCHNTSVANFRKYKHHFKFHVSLCMIKICLSVTSHVLDLLPSVT